MATIGGQKLKDSLNLLLNKMETAGFIKENEKEALFSKLLESLEKSHANGNIPEEIFTDPLQQKKLMSLVVCASFENHFLNSNNPKIAAEFSTENLAKALFAPDKLDPKMNPKPLLTLVLLAQLKPKPSGQDQDQTLKDADKLAEQMLDPNSDKDALKDQLSNDLLFLDSKKQMDLYEFNIAQAFGASDGTPIPLGWQAGNAMGIPDIIGLTGKNTPAGFLNQDIIDNLAKESKDDLVGFQKEYNFGIKGLNLSAPKNTLE